MHLRTAWSGTRGHRLGPVLWTGFSSMCSMARVARKVDDRKVLRLIRKLIRRPGCTVGRDQAADGGGQPRRVRRRRRFCRTSCWMIWTGELWSALPQVRPLRRRHLRVSCEALGRLRGVFRERRRRDPTAAEAEGEPGEVLDPARRATGRRCWVFGCLADWPAGQDPGRPEGDQAAQGSARGSSQGGTGGCRWSSASASSTGSLQLAAGWPTSGPSASNEPGNVSPAWTDGCWPPPAAGPLEGMEDHRRQAAQPADTRYLREQRPQMGG